MLLLDANVNVTDNFSLKSEYCNYKSPNYIGWCNLNPWKQTNVLIIQIYGSFVIAGLQDDPSFR